MTDYRRRHRKPPRLQPCVPWTPMERPPTMAEQADAALALAGLAMTKAMLRKPQPQGNLCGSVNCPSCAAGHIPWPDRERCPSYQRFGCGYQEWNVAIMKHAPEGFNKVRNSCPNAMEASHD